MFPAALAHDELGELVDGLDRGSVSRQVRECRDVLQVPQGNRHLGCTGQHANVCCGW
jgi:hypothetical protein